MRIMIVDDSVIFRRGLRLLLEAAGIQGLGKVVSLGVSAW